MFVFNFGERTKIFLQTCEHVLKNILSKAYLISCSRQGISFKTMMRFTSRNDDCVLVSRESQSAGHMTCGVLYMLDCISEVPRKEQSLRTVKIPRWRVFLSVFS